jgi:hypothetical protein
MRPASYCPKEFEKRLLAISRVERVSIISLGDISTRIVVTGGANIAIAGCILRNFRLSMPGVFSLKGVRTPKCVLRTLDQNGSEPCRCRQDVRRRGGDASEAYFYGLRHRHARPTEVITAINRRN